MTAPRAEDFCSGELPSDGGCPWEAIYTPPQKAQGQGLEPSPRNSAARRLSGEGYRWPLTAQPPNNASNPASSRISVPNDSAFANFEPGLSPATTKSVFLETELTTLPPADLTSAAASSRVSSGRVPVRTMVLPFSGPSSWRR